MDLPLVPSGGGDPDALRVRPPGAPQCAAPVLWHYLAGPPPGYSWRFFKCATAGATVYYQVTEIGAAPGGTWNTYLWDVFQVPLGVRIHAYATAPGLSDSPVRRWDILSP
ncbi:MAG: hypothetical protein KIT22_07145 [Verrucomicrobiae bacterium]|nr:hypothetical protein [Verrucomicrobiae bacterium]